MTPQEYVEKRASNTQILMAKHDVREAFRNMRQYQRENDSGNYIALDFETTSLSPRDGRVRLSAIYYPDLAGPIIIDHNFAGSLAYWAEEFASIHWVVYNAKFEVRWLDDVKPNGVNLLDVDFLAKCLQGGGHSSLAMMAKRDLKLEMDKALQTSDWSLDKLTTAQYQYAAQDAVITYMLYKHWLREIDSARQAGLIDAKFEEAVYFMQDAVRPTVECEDTGVELDIDYHKVNIADWEKKAKHAETELRLVTSTARIPNLNSKKQVSEFIMAAVPKAVTDPWPKTDKTQQLKLDTKTIGPIANRVSEPLASWLKNYSDYVHYNKYLSTYGETLITKQELAGYVSYRLNIAAAATGRFSSSSINIQNLPRDKKVRKAFVPPDPFDTIVCADYKSIEVRVLAELSKDKGLVHDAVYGDLHSEMAAARLGIDASTFLGRLRGDDKAAADEAAELRSKAKAGTFRLTYGAGPGAIADSLGSSLDEAYDFLAKWAAKYPKAYAYRQKMFDYMMQTGHLPIVDGRRVFIPKWEREMPVAANYPIQGAAATVMYRAMYHVQALLRSLFPSRDVKVTERGLRKPIALVASVHDELLLATTEAHVGAALDIIETGMIRGWLDVFPDTDITALVDPKHGPTWGDAK